CTRSVRWNRAAPRRWPAVPLPAHRSAARKWLGYSWGPVLQSTERVSLVTIGAEVVHAERGAALLDRHHRQPSDPVTGRDGVALVAAIVAEDGNGPRRITGLVPHRREDH